MPTLTYDEFCLTTSKELGEIVDSGNYMSRQPVGTLEALISPENTQNTELIRNYDQGNGKDNKVIVKYLQPDAEADATDTITSICDEDGASSAYQWVDVEADQQVQSKVHLLTNAEMRALCEEGSEFRQKLIMNALNSVHRKMNTGLISLYRAGAGGIVGDDGFAYHDYQVLYRDGLLQVDPEGIIQMLSDLEDTGAMGAPILAGGGNIYTYAKMQGIACCNSYGADTSQLEDFRLYKDNQMATVLDNASEANMFFAWMPGSAIFISRPKNKGQFRMVNDQFINDTIIDPITGLEFDFDLDYDKCEKAYKFKLSLNYGLFQQPSVFKSNDTRNGVNYNFAFNATEGAA